MLSRALFHGRVAWDAIPDHRREQWAIYSWWVFSLRKSGKRDVPAFIDCLLCCVCLLLKARSEEFILNLSVMHTAYLAQLLISLCLILAMTASRLSAQHVWIIVSCCKSMGFLRSPEKSLFSNRALPFSLLSLLWVSSQCVWYKCRAVCVLISGLKCHWFAMKSMWYSLPHNPLVRTKAPLGTWTGLEGLWQLKMIQNHTGEAKAICCQEVQLTGCSN